MNVYRKLSFQSHGGQRSHPSRMSRVCGPNVATSKSKLADDSDAVWNVALDDFEGGLNDGQESFVGDECDPKGNVAMLLNQIPSVYKPETAPAFVSSDEFSRDG